MSDTAPAYGLWFLVIVNSAVFILFAFSFFKPGTKRDWRSFGAFSAFLVALFTEMYGYPLTIYFLSGWLQSQCQGKRNTMTSGRAALGENAVVGVAETAQEGRAGVVTLMQEAPTGMSTA